MRSFSFALLIIFSVTGFSQKKDFSISNLSLPPEISYYDNQFSGLYISNGNLFLMSESRLQDSAEAKLYAISLKDIDHKLADSSFTLPFKKYPIYNLEVLRDTMKARGDEYEGLEAIIIHDNMISLSVETTTPSNNCYLLKGIINDTAVILYPNFLLPLSKPITKDSAHIYNAGFEALAIYKQHVYMAFFEFNFFPKGNSVELINNSTFITNKEYLPLSIKRLPFRITDITQVSNNHFTALNYFYKGGGNDEIYRVSQKDSKNDKLIRDSSGYHSYCRLVDIKYNPSSFEFTWKPLWELPTAYWSYNWEGIAAYKKGYFIINDKYTAAKPYSSVLLYIKEQEIFR